MKILVYHEKELVNSLCFQNEVKEQKGRIFSMLLGILLGASLLGNILTGKGIIRAGYGSQDLQSKKGKGIIRAGYGSKRSSINDF